MTRLEIPHPIAPRVPAFHRIDPRNPDCWRVAVPTDHRPTCHRARRRRSHQRFAADLIRFALPREQPSFSWAPLLQRAASWIF